MASDALSQKTLSQEANPGTPNAATPKSPTTIPHQRSANTSNQTESIKKLSQPARSKEESWKSINKRSRSIKKGDQKSHCRWQAREETGRKRKKGRSGRKIERGRQNFKKRKKRALLWGWWLLFDRRRFCPATASSRVPFWDGAASVPVMCSMSLLRSPCCRHRGCLQTKEEDEMTEKHYIIDPRTENDRIYGRELTNRSAPSSILPMLFHPPEHEPTDSKKVDPKSIPETSNSERIYTQKHMTRLSHLLFFLMFFRSLPLELTSPETDELKSPPREEDTALQVNPIIALPWWCWWILMGHLIDVITSSEKVVDARSDNGGIGAERNQTRRPGSRFVPYPELSPFLYFEFFEQKRTELEPIPIKGVFTRIDPDRQIENAIIIYAGTSCRRLNLSLSLANEQAKLNNIDWSLSNNKVRIIEKKGQGFLVNNSCTSSSLSSGEENFLWLWLIDLISWKWWCGNNNVTEMTDLKFRFNCYYDDQFITKPDALDDWKKNSHAPLFCLNLSNRRQPKLISDAFLCLFEHCKCDRENEAKPMASDSMSRPPEAGKHQKYQIRNLQCSYEITT